MLARSGEITEPCPVPLSLTVTIPSSRTPAFSHFWIRRMMRRSPTRCSTNLMSHSWLTVSKEVTTHYPSPRHFTVSDDPAWAASVRGPLIGGYVCHQAPRHAVVAGGAARRQPRAHSRQLDGLDG